MNWLQRRIDKLESKRRGPPRIVFEPVVVVPLDGPIKRVMLAGSRDDAEAEAEPTASPAGEPSPM